MRFPDVERV